MISKEIFEKLNFKPALIPIEKSGIGVDGHKFSLLGMVYLNLKLHQTDGTFYTIEYEPVLVSADIDTPIYGLHSEKAFVECNRRSDDMILTYVPKQSEKPITVKMFHESCENYSSLYVKVAKTAIIPAKHVGTVKGVLNNFETIKKEKNPIVLTTNQNGIIHFPDVINFDNSTSKSFRIDIKNSSDNDLKLKKHSVLCDVIILNERCVNKETINFSSANLSENCVGI